MFRDGVGEEKQLARYSLWQRKTEIENQRRRENRREERECFEALSVEVFPCNVTSYCLLGAQKPLPQVQRLDSHALANQLRAVVEKVKSRVSPLSRENLRPVLFINRQLFFHGSYSDVSAPNIWNNFSKNSNMWSFFLAWHHSVSVFGYRNWDAHTHKQATQMVWSGIYFLSPKWD